MIDNPAILSLPDSHLAVFSALNCEKLLHSIIKFDEGEAQTAFNSFENSITALYSFALGLPVHPSEYTELKDEVESFWPDLDESRNDFASYAFDAFVAMTEALSFVINRDRIHAANCAAAVTDTVDMYVQMASEFELAASELESFIQASPFMKRELKRQATLLEALAKIPVISGSVITNLRSLNVQEPPIDFEALHRS